MPWPLFFTGPLESKIHLPLSGPSPRQWDLVKTCDERLSYEKVKSTSGFGGSYSF